MTYAEIIALGRGRKGDGSHMTVRELIYNLQRVGENDIDSEVVVFLSHLVTGEDSEERGLHHTGTLEGRHWCGPAPGIVTTSEGLPADMPRERKFLVIRLGAKFLPPGGTR